MSSLLNNDAVMVAPVKIKRVALVGSIHHLIRKHTDFLNVVAAVYDAAPFGIEAVRAAPLPFCERVMKKYPHMGFGATAALPVAWRGSPNQSMVKHGFVLALQRDARGRAPDFNGTRLIVEWDFDPRKIVEAIIKYAREDARPADFDFNIMAEWFGTLGAHMVQEAEALALAWSSLTMDMPNRIEVLSRLQSSNPFVLDRLEHIEALLRAAPIEPEALVAHVDSLREYLHNRSLIR